VLLGTWAIDGNSAEVTGFGPDDRAMVLLETPALGIPQHTGAGVTLTLPTGTPGWGVGMCLRMDSAGWGTVVAVNDDGDLIVFPHTDDGPLSALGSASVDIGPTPHTLAVRVVDDPTLGPNNIIEMWWDGDQVGTLVMPRPYVVGRNVGLFAWDFGGDVTAARWDDLGAELPGIDMPSVPAPELTGGVMNWPVPPDVIFAPSVRAPDLTGGWAPIPLWSELGPIFPPSVAAPPLLGGVHATWSDTPDPPPLPGPDDPPWPDGYQFGPPPSQLQVEGRFVTQPTCRPQMNGPGTGSFTTEPETAPALGDEITYTSGGGAVFTGYAAKISTVYMSRAEEAGNLVTVTTPGMLGEDWSRTVVYPDFGSDDPIRTGQPPQDERVWGWPMNGLVVPGLTWTTSVGGDNSLYGTPGEIFPPPDNWPDIRSRWMWTTQVDVKSQPEGWCYFRKAFTAWPGEHSLFVAAYDYARVWIDGVLVATCDVPGEPKRVELPFDWDNHLIAIEGYAFGGGRAGVLLSLLKRDAEGFGGVGNGGEDLFSDAGWKALERPAQSMRSTVGKVLRRLVREAGKRGAPAGAWTCSFTDEADSAGNAWEAGPDAPLLTTKVGITYMDVLGQFAEALIDYRPHPRAKVLDAFVKDSVPASHPVPWTYGVDHTSADSYVLDVASG
jgi:hypothetical protein